jgi:hypothetical protein
MNLSDRNVEKEHILFDGKQDNLLLHYFSFRYMKLYNLLKYYKVYHKSYDYMLLQPHILFSISR